MGKLAIKGHENRGKEVIEILKMLGGQNYSQNLLGGTEYNYYYIGDYSTISCIPKEKIDSSFVKFTLEEFLEKFPYKVGDKVIAPISHNIHTIESMYWSGDKIYYNTVGEGFNTSYTAKDLQPYLEKQGGIIMTNEELFDKTNKAVFEANAQSCDIWNQIKDLDKKVNPCDKCPNNKANNPNASGICNCAAPYFANPIT